MTVAAGTEEGELSPTREAGIAWLEQWMRGSAEVRHLPVTAAAGAEESMSDDEQATKRQRLYSYAETQSCTPRPTPRGGGGGILR